MTAPVPGGADTARNKALARRYVEEVVSGGRLELLDELCTPEMDAGARSWIAPFRSAFPDVRMRIVTLVAEADTVAGRFECSGTHRGEWRGQAATGRRFERVDEVYFLTIDQGRIADAWGLEDNQQRFAQLGFTG